MTNGAEGPKSTSPKRKRARHPAIGSRIASAGLGASAMFGIVSYMEASNQSEATFQPELPAETAPQAAAPVIVVVHRTQPAPVSPVSESESIPQAAAAPAASSPIALTANPVVTTVHSPGARVVQGGSAPSGSAPAPVATSSGSG